MSDKENKNFRMYGHILYYIVRCLEITLKIKVIYPKNFDKDRQFILAFWHNKLLMSLLTTRFVKRRVGLASPSKDGELISVPLERYGFEVVRGSTDKEAARSIRTLVKLVKDGKSIGTPVDGPKGPIYEVKQGLIYIAGRTGVDIVPMGVAYSRKWKFEKAWDKFELPKPFSKAVVVFGEGYKIPDDYDMDVECERLKNKINELEKRAEEILING